MTILMSYNIAHDTAIRDVIDPRHMREGYCSHSVCKCVCIPRYLLYTSFGSLKCDVIRFLTAFRLYELCGFS